MRSRTARALISAALLLLIPLVTADHAADRAHTPQLAVASHGHGPHTPCPPAAEHHCLACAAAALLAPVPDVEWLTPPGHASAVEETDAAEGRSGTHRSPGGRSPPLG